MSRQNRPCFATSELQPQMNHYYVASVAMPRHRERHQENTRSYVVEKASWLLRDLQHVLMTQQAKNGQVCLEVILGPTNSHRLFDFFDAIGGEHATNYSAFSPTDPAGAINYFVDQIHETYGGWDYNSEDLDSPWRRAGVHCGRIWSLQLQTKEESQIADAQEKAGIAAIANGPWTTFGDNPKISLSDGAEAQLEQLRPQDALQIDFQDSLRNMLIAFIDRLDHVDYGDMVSQDNGYPQVHRVGRYQVTTAKERTYSFIIARLAHESGYRVLLDSEYRKALDSVQKSGVGAV